MSELEQVRATHRAEMDMLRSDMEDSKAQTRTARTAEEDARRERDAAKAKSTTCWSSPKWPARICAPAVGAADRSRKCDNNNNKVTTNASSAALEVAERARRRGWSRSSANTSHAATLNAENQKLHGRGGRTERKPARHAHRHKRSRKRKRD